MKNLYLLLLLIPFSFAFGQNIVENGGMEDWTDGVLDVWTNEAGTVITPEFTTFFEGVSAAKFQVVTTTQGDTDFRQSVPVEIGKTYTVSVDVFQLDDGSRARIYATDYGPYSDETLVNQWQTVSWEFTADATGDVEVGLRFYDTATFNAETGSFIIVDNYMVECVDCNSTATELFITSPEDGAILPAGTTEIMLEFVVNNFEIGATDAGLDGHVHYTVDGGSTMMHYSENPINITDLDTGSHTVNLWLVDNNHQPIEPEVNASVTFSIPMETIVSTVEELRTGLQDGSIYTLSGEAILTMQQDFRGQKWVQDETGGILIDDNAGVISTSYNLYDGISGLQGTISEYQGVIQFTPTADPGTASSTGNMITPPVVSVAALNADPDLYESQLIRIENLTTDETGTWSGGGNYDFMASDIPEDIIVVRANFYDADYIGTNLPEGTVHLVGIASEFNGAAQLYPRDSNDIIDNLSVLDPNINRDLVKVAVANNELKIAGFEAEKIAIYNTNGQLVSSSIFVGNLQAGTYIAVMKNAEGKMVNIKFIKK